MTAIRATGRYVTFDGAERKVRSVEDGRVRLGTIEDPWVDGEVVDLAVCERIYRLEVTARWRGGDVSIYIVRPKGINVLTYDPKVVEGLEKLHGDARDGWIAPAPAEELSDINERIYDEKIIAP